MQELEQIRIACGGCGNGEKENDEDEWYGCDRTTCGQWFHGMCLTQTDLQNAKDSLKKVKKGGRPRVLMQNQSLRSGFVPFVLL